MSALGSSLIGLILFLASKSGLTPTVYSKLAKGVVFYAEIVGLIFGTIHTLAFFDIICVACSVEAQEPQ